MHANLFGDFVKGRDFSHYPELIQKGIRLHRTIDHYIDHHPAVVELMHKLYMPLPKIASIAVDLYFDHLLAKYWSEFHPLKLDQFIQNFESTYIIEEHYDKEMFLIVLSKMKEDQWLKQYQTMLGLSKACQGLSNRISFPNVLHMAPEVFIEHKEVIESSFRVFMNDARPFFEEYYIEHDL